MTQKEATQILAILKAAYPNSYRGMTKEEAVGTVNVWATQFINIPANVVMIAVNKLISTNTFPPSIGEVKEKIRGLYWEAWQALHDHARATKGIEIGGKVIKVGKPLDEKTVKQLEQIIEVVEPMRTQSKIEPSLSDLLVGYENYLESGQKQING